MAYAKVISSPHSLNKVSCGFEQVAQLLALTLGPTQGTVICGNPVEILHDSGTIARRVIALPDRAEDVGAMLLRNLAWNMHETYGDGAATAAALSWALVREARKGITAGVNPMLLRRGIERGVEIASDALNSQAVMVKGQDELSRLAAGITHNPEAGRILGEMFAIMGENAAVEIEEYAAPYLTHDYLDGGQWRARAASRLFMPDAKPEIVLENAVVLVVNEPLERVAQIRAVLETLVNDLGKAPLLLVAPEIKGEALNTLTINHTRGAATIAATVLTTASSYRSDDMADIAVLTGGELLSSERGLPPEQTRAAHFGRARRVILTRDTLTIIGGRGEGKAQRIGELRGQLAHLKRLEGHSERVEKLKKRIGRLAGGMGIIKIGAHTQRERDMHKDQAKKAIRVLEAVISEGVVPGGGAAYLACINAVERIKCSDPDEAYGVAVLAKALEAPMRQIVHNHGRMSPSVAINAARKKGHGYGFDAATGEITCMTVMDSLRVIRGALLAAASTASMAISTDTLVLHAKQQLRAKP
jgi:chaperonin GroEL